MPQQTASTTLTGCLYMESQVPGREPNIAERAGVLEDYILATTSDAPEPDAAADAGAASETVGTSGSTSAGAQSAAGAMYKVEHLDDDRLRELVGKRVEVTGHIDAEATDTQPVGTSGGAAPPAPDTDPSPDAIDLPEFEAVSIREVSGTCAPQPAGR